MFQKNFHQKQMLQLKHKYFGGFSTSHCDYSANCTKEKTLSPSPHQHAYLNGPFSSTCFFQSESPFHMHAKSPLSFAVCDIDNSISSQNHYAIFLLFSSIAWRPRSIFCFHHPPWLHWFTACLPSDQLLLNVIITLDVHQLLFEDLAHPILNSLILKGEHFSFHSLTCKSTSRLNCLFLPIKDPMP